VADLQYSLFTKLQQIQNSLPHSEHVFNSDCEGMAPASHFVEDEFEKDSSVIFGNCVI
jgi:hypothetical protein